PRLRVGRDVVRVETVELQARGLQPAVVAGDTVLIKDIPGGGGLRGSTRRPHGGRAGERQQRNKPSRTCRSACHLRLSATSMPHIEPAWSRVFARMCSLPARQRPDSSDFEYSRMSPARRCACRRYLPFPLQSNERKRPSLTM